NGALHALTCPHCGEPAGQADAPLLLCRPGVSSVITGATRVAQIEDNARAASISLPEDVVEQIEVILENRPE
ncbi:MAG TPA: hypothetical protein DEP84_14010, partial [Chloroflexi bacterium]|nr:hypothetical protein [Chloroflexota bacterium]